MAKWKATMPREKAPAGEANVVLAFRKDTSLRVELEGKLTADDAQELMKQAIDMMKRNKKGSK